MKPAEPVLKTTWDDIADLENSGIRPVTYAKNQEEYLPLPVLKSEEGTVTSRWHMTWKERFIAFVTGDVYLTQLTFSTKEKPVKLQPVRLQVAVPTVEELL